MFGNYVEKIKDKKKLTLSNIENLVEFLLKDICEGSSNTNLNTNTQVNTYGDLNLGDLATDDSTKILVSFRLKTEDSRNINVAQTLKDNGDIIKVVYEVIVICQKNIITQTEFLKASQALIDGATNNWNGTASTSTNYEVTLADNTVLSSPLTLNEADPLPILEIKEDNTQLNYLTVTTNIVFTITKIS